MNERDHDEAQTGDWASAFEILEEEAQEENAGAQGGDAADSWRDAQSDDDEVGAGDDGGRFPSDDEDGEYDDDDDDEDDEEFLDGDAVEEAILETFEEFQEQAIAETAEMFLSRVDEQGRPLIRQTDGQLGATINDPDIYRVGNDGVPAFFNPDTGLPFSGDNPRAQAKEWVEMYNDELRETFNTFVETRQNELEDELEPAIDLIEFFPVYKSLDPTRQKMLDAVLDGHEIYDEDEDVIGYDCDLDEALALVNAQIANVQESEEYEEDDDEEYEYEEDDDDDGPALDMRTTPGSNGARGQAPRSLAEAMEMEQNAQLNKLRGR